MLNLDADVFSASEDLESMKEDVKKYLGEFP